MKLDFKKIVASFLLILSHSFILRALGLGKVNCHVVSRPTERPMWQGIDVSGLYKEVPEACPQSVNELESGPSEPCQKPCWYNGSIFSSI